MKRRVLAACGLITGAALCLATWADAQRPTLAPTPKAATDPAPAPSPEPPASHTPARTCPSAADNMVCVQGGTFRMGSVVGDDDERPVRQVTVGAFLMDRHEVSFGEYMQCVQANRCAPPRYYPPEPQRKVASETTGAATSRGKAATPRAAARSGEPPPPRQAEPDRKSVKVKIATLMVDSDLPVAGITWFDARDYCAFVQKHLPTEAQWEMAARGTTGRYYAWGGEAPDCTRANSEKCGKGPLWVGALPASATPEGILNLTGNVWEWVNDWYDGSYYASAPTATCPIGPINVPDPVSRGWTYRHRVLRGGSFSGIPAELHASYRYRLLPSMYSNDIGFRCARSNVPLERTAPEATPLPPVDATPPPMGDSPP